MLFHSMSYDGIISMKPNLDDGSTINDDEGDL